ncbi:hypothetical protein L915_12930 [Phytophthora nicotianae]|uniref:Uncharacterized protein n=1 Tax=Phytophthora nicotianae TaxID=4792 RepID=W2GF14_PHYNI|nr:hypothetical protein L915_12930 [Phytophthora nicotianae]
MNNEKVVERDSLNLTEEETKDAEVEMPLLRQYRSQASPNSVSLQRTQSQHPQRRSQHPSQTRTQRVDLRVVMSDIQLQVQERAEQAAQRYLSKQYRAG